MLKFEMASKKLKKKKLKGKKIEKVHKLKPLKQKKRSIFKVGEGKNCEMILHPKIFTCDRSSKNSFSLSCDESEDTSKVQTFSKIREDYFMYLQTVISDNCVFYDSVVTEETLQDLALELEQNALLACLQIDIYKKSMSKIIRDIKKSTEEKQVHEDVRKLLPESVQENSDNIKPEKSHENSLEIECFSRIPTIASNRIDESSSLSNTNFWTEQVDYNSDAYYVESGQEIYSENLNEGGDSQFWMENETYSSVPDPSGFWSSEVIQMNSSNLSELNFVQIVNDNQTSVSQNNCSDVNGDVNKDVNRINVTPSNVDKCDIKSEKVDPLLVSRTYLQKLVEKTLNEKEEKIQRQRKDEQERAYIAQILEGDDSLEDRLNDSLSDNENESKENIDETNLMDRLDKMREFFCVEEEGKSTSKVLDKPKPSNKVNNASNHTHRPNSWRYEKFIQLHKYSLIAGEMSCERRNVNQKIFLELFGEDSDDEHEKEYSSEEKYRSCCAERISSWVVKYLMPFYHDKRILGRSVFKTLGHHISDTIVDEIQYPDEWTVKYFVSKFFPPKKKYICDADVINFQLD